MNALEHVAHDLGFVELGWAECNSSKAIDGYRQWIQKELHGPLDYLTRHQSIRENPHQLLEGETAGFLIALVPLPFFEGTSRSLNQGHGWIARYARGRDYHKVMRKSLMKLFRWIQEHEGSFELKGRALVDSAPVLERDLAVQAGLGWIGKNGLLINAQWGSSLLIGSLLLSHRPRMLEEKEIVSNHCGRCRACLDVCPTQALDEHEGLDARQCISTWTIEDDQLPQVEQMSSWGNHLFGCDLCQDVCPWNRFALDSKKDHILEFNNHFDDVNVLEFMNLLLDEPDLMLQGTALKRAGRLNLLRNALVVSLNQKIEIPCDLLKRFSELGNHYKDMIEWFESLKMSTC